MELPLQHTPLWTCLSMGGVDCRGSSLSPTVWKRSSRNQAQDYMSRANLSVKVLDFVQLGGLNTKSHLVTDAQGTPGALRTYWRSGIGRASADSLVDRH